MKRFNKILRFRLSDDVVEILNKLPRKSDFVRDAIKEKMIKEKLLKKYKIKF